MMIAILLLSWGVKACQPCLSSTILVEKENHKWGLEVRTTLTALESEVYIRYPKASYNTLDKFKEKVIDIFKEAVFISFDGQNVFFINPEVILGHKTIVLFEFEGLEQYQNIEVINRVFEHIYKSKSTLVFVKKGFKKNKFLLEKENNYQIHLVVDTLSFKMISQEKEKQLFYIVLVFLGVLLLVSIVLFYLFKKTVK